jgi:hypothetical protein
LQADQLLHERSYPIGIIAAPSKIHPQVAAIGPTQVRKRLCERGHVSLPHGIVFVARHEPADAPHPLALLRLCWERPSRRAANPRNKFAPSNH